MFHSNLFRFFYPIAQWARIGHLVRNECIILSLGGIKASEVPNLQEQLRLLFSLVVEHGHRVALIDLQAIPHVTLARWGT